MSTVLAKLDALLSLVDSHSVKKSEDDMKVQSASSGLWRTRKNVPVGACGLLNTVTVDNSVYLLPDHLTESTADLQDHLAKELVSLKDFSGDYYRYCPEQDIWASAGKYPKEVASLYKAASYNPAGGRVTIIGGTHYVFAELDLKPMPKEWSGNKEHKEWNIVHTQCTPDEPVFETTGPSPTCFHVGGVLHMIGGNNSREHSIFEDGKMRTVFQFDAKLKAREVVFCESLDSLFMLGGCLWNEKYQWFREIDAIYACPKPQDVEHIEWRKVKEWRLPYRMTGFGHLLVGTDLVIFGGRRSGPDGGDFLDEVWRINLENGKWQKSKFALPRKAMFRAHLLRNKMGKREVHLFQYGQHSDADQAHCAFSWEDLINSFLQSVDAELPKRAEVDHSVTLKAWMETERVFEQTLFEDLQSIGVETVDDVLELTRLDLDDVMKRVHKVRLEALTGTEDGQRESLSYKLAEVRQHFNAIRIAQSESEEVVEENADQEDEKNDK